eukprot:10788878-Alexandrium_andersonii.AAC.1
MIQARAFGMSPVPIRSGVAWPVLACWGCSPVGRDARPDLFGEASGCGERILVPAHEEALSDCF